MQLKEAETCNLSPESQQTKQFGLENVRTTCCQAHSPSPEGQSQALDWATHAPARATHPRMTMKAQCCMYRLNRLNMNTMSPEVPYFFLWHLVLLLDESFVGFSVDHQGVLVCESAHWVNFDDARRAALPHLECLGSDQLEHPVVAEHLFAINS